MQGYASLTHPLIVMRVDGKSADDLVRKLSRLTYETFDDKAGVLSLDFTDPDMKLIDDPRLVNNRHIDFRIGYSNNMTKERTMTIKEVRPIFPESGIIGLQIKAFDLSVAAKDISNPINWGKRTSHQIAEAIASRYGYRTDVESTSDVPTKDRIQPGKTPDMAYLRELADRIHFDCYLEGSMLVFKKKSYKGAPAFVFDYKGGGLSVVRSFKPNVKSYQQTTPALAGVNDRKKDTVAGKTTDSGEKKSGKTVVSVNGSSLTSRKLRKAAEDIKNSLPSSSSEATSASTIQPTPETSKKTLDEGLKGKLAGTQEKQYDGSLDLIGSPGVYVRNVVRVEGVGRKWSGNYRVGSVRHDVTSTTFLTTLQLRRNALGAGGGSSKVPKKDQVKEDKGSKTSEGTTKTKVVIVDGAGLTKKVVYR